LFIKSAREARDWARRMYDDARTNFWRFLFIDVIGLSGTTFVVGVSQLQLAAGSATVNSYEYHWRGLACMAVAVLLARLGL